ncbi:uncharacterized protein LY79DRAFT_690088 [Colletotrichum navitas]|uniref:Uncharacterized protein n=1 Tax=Colletotrichum navitas TaxID=681940 RepID=A0AAD8PVK5_9PEZI|nr:uncharacterized protein LY79DRAFT_690088 [Colletotrichum navitas]KAK1585431.1 hypothetical protein LY79DRAFT_690088 [Colletotrichum navitas]
MKKVGKLVGQSQYVGPKRRTYRTAVVRPGAWLAAQPSPRWLLPRSVRTGPSSQTPSWDVRDSWRSRRSWAIRRRA